MALPSNSFSSLIALIPPLGMYGLLKAFMNWKKKHHDVYIIILFEIFTLVRDFGTLERLWTDL